MRATFKQLHPESKISAMSCGCLFHTPICRAADSFSGALPLSSPSAFSLLDFVYALLPEGFWRSVKNADFLGKSLVFRFATIRLATRFSAARAKKAPISPIA
jgi:hypothetical protein